MNVILIPDTRSFCDYYTSVVSGKILFCYVSNVCFYRWEDVEIENRYLK